MSSRSLVSLSFLVSAKTCVQSSDVNDTAVGFQNFTASYLGFIYGSNLNRDSLHCSRLASIVPGIKIVESQKVRGYSSHVHLS